MKSSKVLTCASDLGSALVGGKPHRLHTFRSLVPARCQFLPNSPPPRMLGTARTPLHFWRNIKMSPLKKGLMEISKPPYPMTRAPRNQLANPKGKGKVPKTNGPYCKPGAVPSRGVSLCHTTNIGTRVPSLLSYQTCLDLKSSGERPLTSVLLNNFHLSSSFRVSSKR